MNIWILNQYAITPDLPGGTRHFDLASELVYRGHQVVIIATSFHHYMHKEIRLYNGEKWKVEDVNGVKFVWIRTPRYNSNNWYRIINMFAYSSLAWWVGRSLTKLYPDIKKPDVIIGSSPHLLTPLISYSISRHYKVPFVMEVRDLWPQTLIDLGKYKHWNPIIKSIRILERFLYSRASRIITLLPYAVDYINSYETKQKKIVWIPNGVNISRFKGIETIKKESNKCFKAMYFGAHGLANALDVIIKAAKIVQDNGFSEIRFVLVGDGPEKPKLIKLADQLGVSNVEFLDPVPKSEVPMLFNKADAFLFTLEKASVFQYGISPNKLFDYLCAARPIIVSVDTRNNFVKETNSGLTIPPKNPEALAEAVIKLYLMPPAARWEMGLRGQVYVKEHHDIRKLAQKMEQTILEIV